MVQYYLLFSKMQSKQIHLCINHHLEWFLPELNTEIVDDNKVGYLFGLSSDCSSGCIYNEGDYGSNSAYYMTGNFF